MTPAVTPTPSITYVPVPGGVTWSGRLGVPGTYSFCVVWTDFYGATSSQRCCDVLVYAPLDFNCPNFVAVGCAAYASQVLPIGGVGPYSWSLSGSSSFVIDSSTGFVRNNTQLRWIEQCRFVCYLDLEHVPSRATFL